MGGLFGGEKKKAYLAPRSAPKPVVVKKQVVQDKEEVARQKDDEERRRRRAELAPTILTGGQGDDLKKTLG